MWEKLKPRFDVYVTRLDAYVSHLFEGPGKLRFRDYAVLAALAPLLVSLTLIVCCGVIAVHILQPRNT